MPGLLFPEILSAREVILYGRYQPTTVPETGRKHIFELQNMFTTLFPPARSFQGKGWRRASNSKELEFCVEGRRASEYPLVLKPGNVWEGSLAWRRAREGSSV